MRAVRDSTDMPQLKEDQAPLLMHCIGHQAPPLDLLRRMNARCSRIALTTLRYLSRFGNDEAASAGSLSVVECVHLSGGVAWLARPHSRKRGHNHAVGKLDCSISEW